MGDRIGRAIMHGAVAGKLRAFVRENGDGLQGLARLADRHSELAKAELNGNHEGPAPGSARPSRRLGGRSAR